MLFLIKNNWRRLLTAGFVVVFWQSASADQARVIQHLFAESALYQNYIVERSYPQISLSAAYGQLISESKVVEYSHEQVYSYYLAKVCNGLYLINCLNNKSSILAYNHIDLNHESDLSDFPFSQISGYRVSYTTPDMNRQSHPVSGAILIPQSTQQLKGIVIFYHFSVLAKNNVPSAFANDNLEQSLLLASVLASNGYAVVMPDYLGLGLDKDQVHPYIVYPQVNALSGIYMLGLLKQLAPSIKFATEKSTIRVFLSGYSEGAAYSLWAAKIIQDNSTWFSQAGYSLKMTVPLAGAYNLSRVTLPFLSSNLTKDHQQPYALENYRLSAFVKPGLVANVLNSYAGLTKQSEQVFNGKFSQCSGCQVNQHSYDVSGVLQAPLNEFTKYYLLYHAAAASGYSYQHNSIDSLLDPQLLTKANFIHLVASADIYNWRATTPITFISLFNDSVVPALNSKVAYIAMTAKGSTAVKLLQIPNQDYQVRGYLPLSDVNVDHVQGLSYLLLFARNEFNLSESNHD